MRLTEKRQTVGVSGRSAEKSTAYVSLSVPSRARFLRCHPVSSVRSLIPRANISAANCLPPQKEIPARRRLLHRNVFLPSPQDNLPLTPSGRSVQPHHPRRALSLAELGPANPRPDLS